MKKIFILLLLLPFSFFLFAQQTVLPAEARSFILPGYEKLDYVTGDLNGDKRTDAILILKIKGEDTAMADDLSRPMLLLIRQANGKLKVEKRNDNLVMCKQCGGIFGDPYESTAVDPKGFSISFYGGSSWRWSYQYYFEYRAAKKDWFLVKQEESSYHNTEPESTTKESTIEEAEYGETTFEQFKGNQDAETSTWRVTAAKTFFYDNPKLGSKPRKGYLLKGNEATGIRVLKNFVELSFENGKGQFTSGFVLKKDLVEVK